MGAIGGTLFMGGLTTRFLAPFGSKEVDTEEVFAYTSDLLATVPREELSKRLAESAALLSQDLSDHQNMSFGNVYTRLTADLYKYHNIAISNSSVEAKEITQDVQVSHDVKTPDKDVSDARVPLKVPPLTVKSDESAAFKNSSTQMAGALTPEAASFADKTKLSNGTAQHQAL
jgi:hypothetical protein